ncbi:riboflavin synthase domain-like protein [Punctularia strigosozonata HHB-11173 SS5]|uniref:riboflavin synthase domain-like protein n=1 Tax=Punctularia strigosozonata (strain HHB-11173) TaxID=741275 RepID=UPI0004416881|nr:riboflavin synthase domain-like protein [Punctularia strigosozonata HHB-11173 SS5]EIN05749.1 riboflavin synthase domain-like protein [Punctularia strigosozonata HHB-11173 SS5]
MMISEPALVDDQALPRSILVLYATETGTAEDTAYRVARQCERIDFHARVASVDTYPIEELISEPLVVFVISTTGSGKEPRSMTPLWNLLLRSDLPEDLFEDMHFAVFGLGDTVYEKFCWPAKLLERRLLSLGGAKLCDRGEGDDQHRLGLDGAFRPFMNGLLSALLVRCPMPHGLVMRTADDLPRPRVLVRHRASPGDSIPGVGHTPALDAGATYHEATLTCNRRITSEDWYQDVRHLEFRFDDDIQYNPGDIAVIDPEASEEDVNTFLDAMDWTNDADRPLELSSATDQSLPHNIPRTSTLRQLFTRYLDFSCVPRRSFFEALRHFAQDEMEQEKFDEFLSDDGADELYEYCFRVRRTILEVLSEFRSIKIPMEYIFEVFPAMRPRHFSIASSVKRHPHEIHLCVAIVRYRTKLKIRRKGVATSYLAPLRAGTRIRVGIRPGLMSLPPDKTTPVICIGPGTGIAPMRALLEQRITEGAHSNVLYFGCRSAGKDEHYGEEWRTYAEDKKLVYRRACSRDVPDGRKRIYVQDLMVQDEDRKRLWELIDARGAWVYVSGSSNKMPAAVKAALQHVIEVEGGKSSEEARTHVTLMERTGQYTEECWS